jgi:protease IV
MIDPDSPNWERAVLERLALKAIDEQRRDRHWRILFRLLWLTLLFLVFAAFMGWIGRGEEKPHFSGKHTALVELKGVISPEGKASSDRIMSALNAAFKDRNTLAVVLRINSPGGSPVQAGVINDEMRRLRLKYPEIPLYAVVADVAASGAYYVAVAADRIYVDKASIVGSIGVIMDGFGFTGAMDKLGIDRRVITSGENKAFLDPYSPANAQQQEFARKMLEEIHQQFIKVVRAGRGKRLKENPEMFSGLAWSGERSLELGLADALGSLDYVAREVVKAEHVVDFTLEENYLEAFSRRLGASAGETVGRALAGILAGTGGPIR